MRILLTGGSSFTGHGFVEALAVAGHEVTFTCTRESLDRYSEPVRARLIRLLPVARPAWDCRFGDRRFLQVLTENDPWDLVCHHGAEVGDHRREDFPVLDALRANTHGLQEVLAALAHGGRGALLLTGTVFEADEGQTALDAAPVDVPATERRAFSPYGLAKTLTWHVVREACWRAGVRLGKFVVPNPFGPREKPGFTSYLAGEWRRLEKATVQTPDYVRDNIPADLLAGAYRDFAERIAGTTEPLVFCRPSGYVEAQGAFARRFAREMASRWPGVACELEFADQGEFPQPRVRHNTDPARAAVPGWRESRFWDELAAYYVEVHGEAAP